MENKMTERRNTLGRVAIASRLNSPLSQKRSNLFFIKQNSLTTKSVKAFSIAEVAIALLIGSLILGMAAPMITKNIKNENFNDLQFKILSSKMVPAGAIMFFEGDCPDRWIDISSKYAGRYIRIAGENSICEQGSMNVDGSCSSDGVKRTETLNPAVLQGETSRRVWGVTPGTVANLPLYKSNRPSWNISPWNYNLSTVDTVLTSYVSMLKDFKMLGGSYDYLEQSDVTNFGFESDYVTRYRWTDGDQMYNMLHITGYPQITKYVTAVDPGGRGGYVNDHYTSSFFINSFDNSRQIPTGDENRPKTVVLRACKSP